MNLFDVFLSFNADFNLSVKHNGNIVSVMFTIVSGEPKPPIVIAIDKSQTYSVEQLRSQINAAFQEIANTLQPVANQLSAMMAAAEEKKSEKKSSKETVLVSPEEKQYNDSIQAMNTILARNATVDELRSVLLKANELTKKQLKVSEELAVAHTTKYQELSEKYDSLTNSLF